MPIFFVLLFLGFLLTEANNLGLVGFSSQVCHRHLRLCPCLCLDTSLHLSLSCSLRLDLSLSESHGIHWASAHALTRESTTRLASTHHRVSSTCSGLHRRLTIQLGQTFRIGIGICCTLLELISGGTRNRSTILGTSSSIRLGETLASRGGCTAHGRHLRDGKLAHRSSSRLSGIESPVSKRSETFTHGHADGQIWQST